MAPERSLQCCCLSSPRGSRRQGTEPWRELSECFSSPASVWGRAQNLPSSGSRVARGPFWVLCSSQCPKASSDLVPLPAPARVSGGLGTTGARPALTRFSVSLSHTKPYPHRRPLIITECLPRLCWCWAQVGHSASLPACLSPPARGAPACRGRHRITKPGQRSAEGTLGGKKKKPQTLEEVSRKELNLQGARTG